MKKRYDNHPDHELEVKWSMIKENFAREYSCLNSNDLYYSQGEFDKMLNQIGEKTGMTASRLRHKIMRWDNSWLHFF